MTRNHSARAPASSRVRVAGGRAGAVRHTIMREHGNGAGVCVVVRVHRACGLGGVTYV